MIEVVFRDEVNSLNKAAGFGTLLVPEDSDIENYIGHTLSFTVTRQIADSFPSYPGELGVVAEIHQQEYFEFEIVEATPSDAPLYSGRLIILSKAEPKHGI